MSRKSEEYLKSPLTDVSEENELDFVMERLIRSSISPDGVFARPPKVDRKTSNGSMGGDLYLEATGRRRSSDHGVVLTTDTDSFIIGQKVWVGGIRPGQIAYIGETHFAPGEWAGVVLDEPNGKNDGCVSGKRYFQCEPKKGIFSRLTRLTHYPLPNAFFGKEPSPGHTSRSILSPERSRTTSPTSSIRSSMLKSPGKLGMTVGDRVIVSSGLGSRPGILKYMGETKFSQGHWCGIQLDEPTGKNDGSVDGVKYFDCPPKYGIFVPIAKVSLSPSSRKSRLSRAGSRESLTSVGTLNSVATTNTSRLRMSAQKIPSVTKIVSAPKNTYSLQDVIREKQNHIEQLMIERDLDREDAQNQAMTFQKNISELRGRVADLEKLLEDEKKKTEDLQYNIDEAQFCGDELNAQTQVYKEKISELENCLLSSGQEGSSELEFKQISLMKEANETLQKDLENCRNKLEESTKDFERKINDLCEKDQKLEEQLRYVSNENEENKKELLSKDERAEKLYLNIQELQNTLNEETIQMKESVQTEEAKHSLLLKTCDEKDCLLRDLTADNNELNKKIEFGMKEKEELSIHLQELEKENLKIKTDLENSLSESTKIKEMFQAKVEEYEQQQQKINLTETDNQSWKKIQLDLIAENGQLKSDVETKNQEVLDLTKNLLEAQKIKEDLSNVVEKVQSNLSEASNARSLLESEFVSKEQEADMHKILIEELNAKLKSLQENIVNHENVNSKLQTEITTCNDAILKYKSEYETIQKELETITLFSKTKQDELSSITSEYNTKIELLENIDKDNKRIVSELEKERSELSSEIISLKKKVEAYVNTDSDLTTLQQNFLNIQEKNEELIKIQVELQKELNSLKDENSSKLSVIEEQSKKLDEYILLNNNKQIECDQLNITNNGINKQCENLKTLQKSLENRIAELELENGDTGRKNEALSQRCNEIANQHQILQQELSNLRNTSSDTNSEIVRLTSNLVDRQKAYEELLDGSNSSRNKLEKELQESNQIITSLKKEIEGLNEKIQLIDENKNKLEQVIEIIKETEKSQDIEIGNLKLMIESEKKNFATVVSATSQESESMKSQLDSQITSLQKELNILETELRNTKESVKSREELLLKEIENYGNEKEKLVAELKGIQDSKVSLETSLEQQKKNESSSVEMLTNQLNRNELDINSLKQTNTTLQELNDSINVKLSDAVSTSETLQTERNHLLSETKKQLEDIEQFKVIIKEKDETHSSLLNQNNDLQNKVIARENDISETNRKLESLRDENLAIINLLKTEIGAKEALNLRLEENLKEERKRIEDLQQNSDQLSENTKQELLNAVSTSETLQTERNHLLSETKKHLEAIEQFKALLKEKDEAHSSLLNQNNDLQNKVIARENDISETNRNLESLRDENIAIINLLKTEIGAKEALNLRLEQELKEERKRIEDLLQNSEQLSENTKQELLNKNTELTRQVEEIVQLNQSVGQLQTDLNNNKSQLNEITSNFTAQIDSLKKIVAEKTEENSKLLKDVLDSKDRGSQEQELSLKLTKEVELQNLLSEKYELLINEHRGCTSKIAELEHSLRETNSMFDSANTNLTKLELSKNSNKNSTKSIQSDYDKLHEEFKKLSTTEKLLRNEISTLKSEHSKQSLISNINSLDGNDSSAQINFLNTIIADMQKKNETLKARIDTLESISMDFTQPAAFNLVGKRNPAPRLFCDICDEFDAHDTEDCPLQSSDSPIPPALDERSKDKKIPLPRKYCESCEAFGHDTGECAEEETY